MEAKQLEIACPCCTSRILVDVRTGKVLRTLPPEEHDAQGRPVVRQRDWDQALGRVQERTSSQQQRLDDALAREKDKASRLDDLFRKASEKLDEEEPGQG
jgi:hypothetical protein